MQSKAMRRQMSRSFREFNFFPCRFVVSIHAMFRCPNKGVAVNLNRGLSQHGSDYAASLLKNVDRYKVCFSVTSNYMKWAACGISTVRQL